MSSKQSERDLFKKKNELIYIPDLNLERINF